MTWLHNDTNMMAMGAGVVGENLAFEIADTMADHPLLRGGSAMCAAWPS